MSPPQTDHAGAAQIKPVVAQCVNSSYRQRMVTTPSSSDAATNQGDFYVESGCCLSCGIPEDIAPEVFQTGEDHCFVKRQPCSRSELDRTIRAMWSSEVDCIRYRGNDAEILDRLARAHMIGQADHPPQLDETPALRDRVSFEIRLGDGLPTSASQVASAMRNDMLAEGSKVLPAFLGRRTVWVSWFQDHFHCVHFTRESGGKFVAHLQTQTALEGLAWLVDDWLRARGAENICWEATGDLSSASPTPM